MGTDQTRGAPPRKTCRRGSSAHERLSTGALARWMRACATHPWRVVFGWVGIVAAPDRARRDGRRQPAGRVRDPGVGHAEGDRPDRGRVRLRAGRRAEPRLRRARRASGSTRRSARRRSRRRSRGSSRPSSSRPTGGQGRHRERRRSVQRGHVLRRRPHRLRRGAVRPSHLRGGPRRRSSPSRTPSARRSSRPGVTVEFNGDAEFPPIEQGTQELLGLLAALIVLLIVFRTFVATAIPIALALTALATRVPAAVHPRRPHRHQHDHAAARVDDRPRRRHRLLAVHRHALQTAPARRALTDATPPPRPAPPRAAPCSSPA